MSEDNTENEGVSDIHPNVVNAENGKWLTFEPTGEDPQPGQWPSCYRGKVLVCEILTDILELTLFANPNEREAIAKKIEELRVMYRIG